MADQGALSSIVVLLAEDDEFSRKMTTAMLLQVGVARVIEVSDGRAALDILVEADPAVHVVIADIDMPRMDGLTLAQKIGNGDEGCDPSMPVILLTAKTHDIYREAANARNVASFLTKPPSVDTIRKTVLAAIGDE